MTLQQEAHNRIDKMSDRGIRLVLEMIDQLQFMAAADFNAHDVVDENVSTADIVTTIDTTALDKMTKADKKALFLESCGNMRIDATAVRELRERSMI